MKPLFDCKSAAQNSQWNLTLIRKNIHIELDSNIKSYLNSKILYPFLIVVQYLVLHAKSLKSAEYRWI